MPLAFRFFSPRFRSVSVASPKSDKKVGRLTRLLINVCFLSTFSSNNAVSSVTSSVSSNAAITTSSINTPSLGLASTKSTAPTTMKTGSSQVTSGSAGTGAATNAAGVGAGSASSGNGASNVVQNIPLVSSYIQPAFYQQQPYLHFEDMQLVQPRMTPMTGYYEYQPPTSLGAGVRNDGTAASNLASVAYPTMAADGRFARTDNNSSPVQSQQTGSSQQLMNLPPYAYFYGTNVMPSGFQQFPTQIYSVSMMRVAMMMQNFHRQLFHFSKCPQRTQMPVSSPSNRRTTAATAQRATMLLIKRRLTTIRLLIRALANSRRVIRPPTRRARIPILHRRCTIRVMLHWIRLMWVDSSLFFAFLKSLISQLSQIAFSHTTNNRSILARRHHSTWLDRKLVRKRKLINSICTFSRWHRIIIWTCISRFIRWVSRADKFNLEISSFCVFPPVLCLTSSAPSTHPLSFIIFLSFIHVKIASLRYCNWRIMKPFRTHTSAIQSCVETKLKSCFRKFAVELKRQKTKLNCRL